MPPSEQRPTLELWLQVHGPSAPRTLVDALQISQPTLWRMVQARSASIFTLGQRRATRHALRRSVSGLPASLPIYRIDAEGNSSLAGALHPVHPGGYGCEGEGWSGFYPDLPWFLQSLRPQGFLGRMVPLQHPELGFASDVRLWSGDQALAWMSRFACDPPGDLVVGDEVLTRLLDAPPPEPVPRAERGERYPRLAEVVLRAGLPGSSGGGEQPKFLATREDDRGVTPVLVKFSGVTDTPERRRVADLLRLEALALDVVGARGIAAARAEIVEGEGRVFLEVERFDRVGARGRRGVVPLDILDAENLGSALSWTQTARGLSALRLISEEDLGRVLWLDRFGAFIGNSDRHGGNLSFYVVDGRVGALCPLYDMLPMAWMPRSGELVDQSLALPALTPERGDLWVSAWRAAVDYWARAAELPLDPSLLWIARQSRETLLSLEEKITRLPGALAAV